MPDQTSASSESEVRAAEAVEQHHAQLAGALALRRESLSAVVAARQWAAADRQRLALVSWCRSELVPHALAEEQTLYAEAAKRSEARLLVEAMLAEHKVLVGLVDDLERTTDVMAAAELARALTVLFSTHLAKENEQLLPLLVAAPEVSVAHLLGGMHELIGADVHAHGDSVHEGGRGESDDAGDVRLDSRSIPHAIRHATIFGALDGLRPGQRLVLSVSHDPLPLLAQLAQREPGTFDVEYLERGPDVWRLSFRRQPVP